MSRPCNSSPDHAGPHYRYTGFRDRLPGFIKKLKYLPAYKNPVNQMTWLRTHVFDRARKKQQTDGLTWLGIGAAFLWLISRDDE